MNCNCSCDYDGGSINPCTVTFPIARKSHRCCECHSYIKPGERYERVVGLHDGDWVTYKTCHLCLRIRKDLFPSCWTYTELRDDVYECLGFDYITNE